MSKLGGISAVALILGAVSSTATAGQWRCYRDVAAFTERRAFTQPTGFECGGVLLPFWPYRAIYPGHCGDWSHTAGLSFVDWIGGVSASCDDHDEGFMGPYNREWQGCSINDPAFQSSPLQQSTSLRWIGGVNRHWSAWPWELYEGIYEDYQLAALDGATVHMRNASGQLGDLDECRHIQELNWVNWGSFPLGVFIAHGNPFNPSGLLNLRAGGRGDYSCSPEGDMCRPQYCSDLIVNVSLTCEPAGGSGGYCGDGVCDSNETSYGCSDCW